MRKNPLKYPVTFTDDLFNPDNPALADTLRAASGTESPRVMLVSDMNFVQHAEGIGTKIGAYVQSRGIELASAPTVIPGGEKRCR